MSCMTIEERLCLCCLLAQINSAIDTSLHLHGLQIYLTQSWWQMQIISNLESDIVIVERLQREAGTAVAGQQPENRVT